MDKLLKTGYPKSKIFAKNLANVNDFKEAYLSTNFAKNSKIVKIIYKI
jgi:hypothetical protein